MPKVIEDQDIKIEEVWRKFLVTGEYSPERRMRHFFGVLPHNPRCKMCYAPFQGVGAQVVRVLFGKRPAKMNPKFCNVCEEFASRYHGGLEIELSLLFADVRGSTTLAESMSVYDFSRLIDRFYRASTDVLIRNDALIDKLIGDEVTGLFVPGFAGEDHARRAIEAGVELLHATGHGGSGDPWVPVGVGIHTGVAFVGAVGSTDGVTDITALGDAPNVAARLASLAGAGVVLVSEEAGKASGLVLEGLEMRSLELKGRSGPVNVWAIRSSQSIDWMN
jgi:adenylate cyclase